MADEVETRRTSERKGRAPARQRHQDRAQWGGITPRWLVNFLPGCRSRPASSASTGSRRRVRRLTSSAARRATEPRPAGDLRRLRREPARIFPQCGDHRPRRADPRLRPLQQPHDQIQEQLRLPIETVKERQEGELINNPEYGLLANVAPSQHITTRNGAPTPDDLDELLTKVWKEPAFFLAHPRAIAAFGRECTRRGVPPPTVSLFGSQFLTWRGMPLVPSDKVPIEPANGREDQDPADAHRREEAGRGRPVPAGRARRDRAEPVGALHGHQPQGDRLLPDLALLLAGRADRRRAGGARGRRDRPLPGIPACLR